MKLPIAILVGAACAVACSRDTGPARAPANSAAAAPARTPAATETSLALTPASGAGAPRAASAQLVPSDAQRDQSETASDEESIRDIRALLAADRALAPIAARVNIVARSGRVWLRGQVNTAEQRAGIEKAARRAVGVIDVNNELVVLSE